jgi:tRNA(Ile2) C34 agmatinyltransferase TiaS
MKPFCTGCHQEMAELGGGYVRCSRCDVTTTRDDRNRVELRRAEASVVPTPPHQLGVFSGREA